MRWDNLFKDLEAQLETVLGDEAVDAARDSERARRSSQSLAEALIDDLLTGDVRAPVKLCTAGVDLWITVDNFGSDWISGEVVAPAQNRGYCVINLACVEQVVFSSRADILILGALHEPHHLPIGAARRLGRITLRIVLRDLVRRRKSGWIATRDSQIHGTLDRVGKDFVEIAEHAPHVPRRQESIENRVWVQLSSLAFFRLDD